MRIDDEADVLGDFVIQDARIRIAGLCVPVDAADASSAGSVVNGFDECSTNAAASKRRRSEQILQVARELDPIRASMKKIMGETGNLAINFGDQPKYLFCGIEEAIPRGLCNRERQCSLVHAPIERVVAVPQGQPCGKVDVFNRANSQ